MSFIGDPWLRMQGIRRITAEFRYMSNLIMKGRLPQLSDLHLPNDNIFQWRVHVSGFDEEQAPAGSGAAVNRDLQKLQSSCGQGFMLLELLFPEDDKYPTAPFFLRVVTPRCRMYTGHVTAGGSICIKVRQVSRHIQLGIKTLVCRHDRCICHDRVCILGVVSPSHVQCMHKLCSLCQRVS